jgi:co-chaperonin GroES (HSP10)
MDTVNSIIYFSRPDDKERKDEIVLGHGQKIFVDTTYDAMKKVNQVGVIEHTNDKMRALGLKEGRKVVVHHFCLGSTTKDSPFVSEAKKINGKKLFKADFPVEVFAYEHENEWHPVNEWVFVIPISRKNMLAEQSSLTLPEHLESEQVEQVGVVVALNEKLKDQGVKIGDKILFTRESEYEVDLEDQKVYIMENQDIVSVINDQTLSQINVLG